MDSIAFFLLIGGLWLYSRLCLSALVWQFEEDIKQCNIHNTCDIDKANYTSSGKDSLCFVLRANRGL